MPRERFHNKFGTKLHTSGKKILAASALLATSDRAFSFDFSYTIFNLYLQFSNLNLEDINTIHNIKIKMIFLLLTFLDPKKGSGSKGSQDSAVSSTSGSQQQQQQPGEPIRQRLQRLSVSTASDSQQQQQQRGPRARAQQQRQPQQQQHGQGRGQRQDWSQGRRGQAQSGMQRAESTQSVQSESSQGAWGDSQHSGSSGGAGKGKKPTAKEESLSEATKIVDRLKVDYKGAGTRGRKLGQIETNYLQLFFNKMVENAYHYDIQIEPDRPKKLLPMVFLRFVEINLPNVSIAFDGKKNAYAAAPIKIKEFQREIEIIHPETGAARKFMVSIQEANDSRIPIRNVLST